MLENAVLLDHNEEPLYWHTPEGRSSVSIPDSRTLWDVIWQFRDEVKGLAHSHPGLGRPWPSYEDLSTFRAVEKALGQKLWWWITTRGEVAVVHTRGDDFDVWTLQSGSALTLDTPWLRELRRISYEEPTKLERAKYLAYLRTLAPRILLGENVTEKSGNVVTPTTTLSAYGESHTVEEWCRIAVASDESIPSDIILSLTKTGSSSMSATIKTP